jgi:hypothetical protein
VFRIVSICRKVLGIERPALRDQNKPSFGGKKRGPGKRGATPGPPCRPRFQHSPEQFQRSQRLLPIVHVEITAASNCDADPQRRRIGLANYEWGLWSSLHREPNARIEAICPGTFSTNSYAASREEAMVDFDAAWERVT